jgi:hypothetical protein
MVVVGDGLLGACSGYMFVFQRSSLRRVCKGVWMDFEGDVMFQGLKDLLLPGSQPGRRGDPDRSVNTCSSLESSEITS